MENDLFDWDSWDGDHECMTYYNVVLKVPVDLYLPGEKFSAAQISFETSTLQLYRKDEIVAEVKLKLVVVEA